MKIGIQGELGAYSHIAVENLYKDADIKTFAQDIALLTDKTIILDPRVKGLITIYSDAPLNSESIWEVFLSTMEVQGCLLYTSPSPRDS